MLKNIKNLLCIKLIFGNLLKRIKLNLLKHNKSMMSLLKIKKKDFQEFLVLKEISKNLKTDIKDVDTIKLNLDSKNFKEENLKCLSQFEFKQVKELNLSYNNISNLEIFQNFKFEKLEIFNLEHNNIKTLKGLEKANFKKLKVINLSENQIDDIDLLENIKYVKLETLTLYSNKISNINILEKINFKELKELNVSKNRISYII